MEKIGKGKSSTGEVFEFSWCDGAELTEAENKLAEAVARDISAVARLAEACLDYLEFVDGADELTGYQTLQVLSNYREVIAERIDKGLLVDLEA